MSPYLRVHLPKVGYNRNMPRAVIFGPRKLGGDGYARGYPSQCVTALEDLMGHLQAGDDIGKLVLICLSYLQLIARVEWGIMLHAGIPLRYLPECWQVMVRNFVGELDGSIQIQDTWTPHLMQEHDVALMGVFVERGATVAELKMLNGCRIYL